MLGGAVEFSVCLAVTHDVFPSILFSVMPGLVPGIHAFAPIEDVDGRDKPGHDGS
jgi:hypothetical protein